MNRIVTLSLHALVAAALSAAGCGGSGQDAAPAARSDTAAATPPSRAAGDSHAAGIVPGSYEDWCAEHGVPETVCTRCDATLIAAFKATGDWCGEHGVPKSQCLACDPNLKIMRPPNPEEVQ